MIDKYPLQWPVGYARTKSPDASRFEKRSLTKATKEVNRQVELMKGKDVIISSNIPIRLDGLPRIDYEKRSISDKGVAVYFTYKGEQKVLACDKWNSVEDNIWAIATSIDAMRLLERRGVSEILDRTFTGFIAIPERASGNNCWDVLGIAQTKDATRISEAFKAKIKLIDTSTAEAGDAISVLKVARDEAIHYSKQ